MSPGRIAELRVETQKMFYHGFSNYMNVAFPEDELRPVSCVPLTRDQNNPKHVEINDVLGNYSLTLIDSLSTLAILASAPPDEVDSGAKALRDFQDGIASLIVQYGDGTEGPSGKGLRARGFDLDSKVQVFETVIRGVGGLLSAHLFAAGELPIDGYKPRRAGWSFFTVQQQREVHPPIVWPNGFKYDGQLLRLALDLAQRLLPAFYTNTGMPYPRVNLRHGIPFYQNSPLHQDSEFDGCGGEGQGEITETCSAGAGSLVLEFTVLSRLTGDPRFEQLAKRAFWAVWSRRSPIGLIGAGVDAEAGHWIGAYAGIGAGADSFFEYALKTHILLSGQETPNTTIPYEKRDASWLDPNTIYRPLTDAENSPESFLLAWKDAHAAIKRHLYSNTHHPHYINAHLNTGSPQAYWIDSLGAYYPGLLTLAGELEEAIETNLLYTALWTRYSALPERWSITAGNVEGGLGWWPGRPEFIESNYHLYRATKDPWYLHVGEMVLEDIKRRCWTECGWAGLQDVRTGEKSDRMESFFLGETAKYLYLLFDADHPLNSLDAPYVFTTEGHPLIIPQKLHERTSTRRARSKAAHQYPLSPEGDTCPVPPALVPLTISATAARSDVFHAASLIGLHHIPNVHAIVSKDSKEVGYQPQGGAERSIINYTYYPWTLPQTLIPGDAICARLPLKTTFSVEFPSNSPLSSTLPGLNIILAPQALVRLNNEGIMIKSLQGLKLGMVQEDSPRPPRRDGRYPAKAWRIWNIGNTALGRDEKIFVRRDVIGAITDPSFTRVRDAIMLDLILQIENPAEMNQSTGLPSDFEDDMVMDHDHVEIHFDVEEEITSATAMTADRYKTMLSSFLQHVTSALRDPVATLRPHLPQPETHPTYHLRSLAAITPTGLGAAPIPEPDEAPDPSSPSADTNALTWTSTFFAGQACDGKLPDEAVKAHQLIVMKRGGCTFSRKIANIPAFMPSHWGFQLLVIVSLNDYDDGEEEEDDNGGGGDEYDHLFASETSFVRPLLDEQQRTPAGLVRHHQVPMVMVEGGHETYEMLRSARSVGLRRRYHVESQGQVINNLIVV
ncbi:MAG: alpha mannosidase-like protein [Claussenomyces sp. TS43310]|nr:MAG: alpha mannosidase-like protein [Claussenomyces sp. TS43310]